MPQRFLGTIKLTDESLSAVVFSSAATTVEAAIREYAAAHPNQSIIKLRRLQGGSREGAGRKAKYCEIGKAVRLPQTMAENVDKVIPDIIDLVNLCDEYRELCENSPTSPRYEKLREFLRNAEQILEDLRPSVRAAIGENT